jgi:hypothetical protein
MSMNAQIVRCAVYTRKSTEENLALEFNSLDAQREAAEAYIASQKHAGWHVLCHPGDIVPAPLGRRGATQAEQAAFSVARRSGARRAVLLGLRPLQNRGGRIMH